MTNGLAAEPAHDLPGRLIIVEGIDGSGKSTQLDLLHKWLVARGYCVYLTEWNSSPIVRETTRLGKARRLLTPMTFSLIHAADFADRFEQAMLPVLRAGGIVLADRYIYTAFARDAARGVDADFVREVYGFAPVPTIAVYFRVPLAEALDRILSGRPELKWYEAGMDLGLSPDPYESFRMFQGRVLEQYERMVGEFGLKIIDATRPIFDQQMEFRRLVRPHLDGARKTEVHSLVEALRAEGLTGRYLSASSRPAP